MQHLSINEANFRTWLLAGNSEPRLSAGRDEQGRDTVRFHLANAAGDTVELLHNGWRIASDPERAARRHRSTGGLPRPDYPRSLPVEFTAIRNLLNLTGVEEWNRCLCWLLAALRPHGPYPTLVLTGPKSSGKTTAALLLRSLIDPAQHPLDGPGEGGWVRRFRQRQTPSRHP